MHHSTLLLEDQQGKLKCTPEQWHPRKMERPKDKKKGQSKTKSAEKLFSHFMVIRCVGFRMVEFSSSLVWDWVLLKIRGSCSRTG